MVKGMIDGGFAPFFCALVFADLSVYRLVSAQIDC
jgi:hypothetical protein